MKGARLHCTQACKHDRGKLGFHHPHEQRKLEDTTTLLNSKLVGKQ